MDAGARIAEKAVIKSMETVDDVVVALLNLLARKADPVQRTVLQDFAEHEKNGGRIYAFTLRPDRLNDFASSAEKAELEYYAAEKDGKVTVLYRDCDLKKLDRAVTYLDLDGKPLYRNPQLHVAEYFAQHPDIDPAVAETTLDALRRAKYRASEAGISYAVIKTSTGYIAMFDPALREEMKGAGIISSDARIGSLYGGDADIRKVREIVANEKDAEKQREIRRKMAESSDALDAYESKYAHYKEDIDSGKARPANRSAVRRDID